MRQVQHLYQAEARLREQKAGPRLRAAVRAHQSQPIVRRIERTMVELKQSGRHLPESLLGLALAYALGQWPATNDAAMFESSNKPCCKRIQRIFATNVWRF